jgi:hypothetical protein
MALEFEFDFATTRQVASRATIRIAAVHPRRDFAAVTTSPSL